MSGCIVPAIMVSGTELRTGPIITESVNEGLLMSGTIYQFIYIPTPPDTGKIGKNTKNKTQNLLFTPKIQSQAV